MLLVEPKTCLFIKNFKKYCQKNLKVRLCSFSPSFLASQLEKSDGIKLETIWKLVLGNGSPSRVRMQELNANLTDGMQFG